MPIRNPVPSPLAIPAVLVLALALSGCGPGDATVETASAAAEPEAAAVSALASEPLLWSRSPHPYQDFRTEPVRALHASVQQRLGEPLHFRIVPYVDRNEETGEWFLKGETLTVLYQETEASLTGLRKRADELIVEVRNEFPGLDENDSLMIYARLPEGKSVADLDPELRDACGENNSVRAGARPSEYLPGELDELYFALCDSVPALDRGLQDPRKLFVEENYWTSHAAP